MTIDINKEEGGAAVIVRLHPRPRLTNADDRRAGTVKMTRPDYFTIS